MSLRFAGVALVGMVMGFGAGAASAAEHVVKMVNDNGKGDFMAFEPSFVTAAPGDTVKFVVVDPGQNAETIPEIWPDGAKQRRFQQGRGPHRGEGRRLRRQMPSPLWDGDAGARER